MSDRPLKGETKGVPRFELWFSPRELVKSVLSMPGEPACECGVKGREVRWQQGAIAVCILMVFSRLKHLEGSQAVPVLEGEQGSPARSIDNLLNKPGDWALHMFGEANGLPRIRDFIYRKRTVSRSNPLSSVQLDAEKLAPSDIRIWQAEVELTTVESLQKLLRTLLEEFNPRRAAKEWDRLFSLPDESPVSALPVLPQETPNPPATVIDAPASRVRPAWWAILGGVVLFGLGIWLGSFFAESADPPLDPTGPSAAVVEAFIETLNAGDLQGAYGLTSSRYREAVSLAAFDIAYGRQRYNFPRVAGNPYRNSADSPTHDYRVTLYVETRVQRIPGLGGLSRLPLARIEDYADRIAQLVADLTAAGIDAGLLNQLSKERLERRDASRHIQLVCGLSHEAMAAIYPEEIATTLDLTLFFELVKDPANGTWRIQSIEDATERLVVF